MNELTSFRCSELDRLLSCHASRLIAAKLPIQESGAAAHEGNWCHWQAARDLVDQEGATVGEEGLPSEPECGDFSPNGFAQFVVDFFVSEVVWQCEGMSIIVEETLSAEFPNFRLTGHSDVLAFSPDGTHAKGFDLKAGAIPVDPAEENNQMLGYMVLVSLCYPTVEHIEWSIVQPKNCEDDGYERVSTVKIEGKDKLEKLVKYLNKSLNNVIDNPYLIDSDENNGAHCKYCPAALTAKCPAITQDIQDMKATLEAKDIAAISPDLQIDELLYYEESRKKFATAFDSVTKSLKQKLKDLPDASYIDPESGRTYYLKQQKGARKFTDMRGALQVVDAMELNEDERADVLNISLSNLERVISKKRDIPLSGKKDETGKKVVEDALSTFYKQATNELIKVK